MTSAGGATNSAFGCAPMLNQLVKYKPTAPKDFFPDLAESWELSADGTIWTFRLRKSAPGVSAIKLHNGATLTAVDALFSLDRILVPPPGITVGPSSKILQSYIQSIEVLDLVTLRVTTKFSAPSFLANVASVHAAVYPKALAEALSPPSMVSPCQVVASGPFKCKEFMPGQFVRVERFSNYFVPGRPYLDGVDAYVVPDAATRLAAFKTGQIHTIPTGITASQAVDLQASMATLATVQQLTRNLALALILNTTMTHPEFGPILFGQNGNRRAVNLVLDRDALASQLGLTKGDLVMPGGQWTLSTSELLAREGYGNKAAEVALADQLLADAGYPNGFATTITASPSTLPSGVSHVAAAELVASQLLPQPININASINVFDSATYYQKLRDKDYQMAITTVGEPLDDVDLMFTKEYLCSAPVNFTGLCDSQMDTLFSQQQQELNSAARLTKARQLTSHTMDQNAFLIVGWEKGYVPVRNTVADFQAHPTLVQNARWEDVWFNLAAPAPIPIPTPIPSLGLRGLVALAVLLGLAVVWASRMRRAARN
ncbi:MAG: ABC transporter substrate-binding protein [Chloroflexi bacterium]|nr:ABC transporter substrate-binding protein [Chloroflexota bacterium]